MPAVLVIYLADVLCNVKIFLNGVGIFICAITFFAVFILSIEGEFYKISKHLTKIFITTISCLLLASLIPNKQTMYMMAAAKVGQDILESPKTQEISDKVLKIINNKLDEELSKDIKK